MRRGGAIALVLATRCARRLRGLRRAAGPTSPSRAPPRRTGAASPTATGRPTVEPAEEGCPYLTAEQVTAVLGADTAETAGTATPASSTPWRHGPSVMLSRVDIQIDPAEYAVQSKALCQGDVTDVEAATRRSPA
jgi:hypothetical protein